MLQTRGGGGGGGFLRTQPWTQLLLPPATHEVKPTKSMLCVWDTQQMGDNRDGSKEHWVDQGLSSSSWGPDLSPEGHEVLDGEPQGLEEFLNPKARLGLGWLCCVGTHIQRHTDTNIHAGTHIYRHTCIHKHTHIHKGRLTERHRHRKRYTQTSPHPYPDTTRPSCTPC